MDMTDVDLNADGAEERYTTHIFDRSQWPFAIPPGPAIQLPPDMSAWPPTTLFNGVYGSAVMHHFCVTVDVLKKWENTFYPSGPMAAVHVDDQTGPPVPVALIFVRSWLRSLISTSYIATAEKPVATGCKLQPDYISRDFYAEFQTPANVVRFSSGPPTDGPLLSTWGLGETTGQRQQLRRRHKWAALAAPAVPAGDTNGDTSGRRHEQATTRRHEQATMTAARAGDTNGDTSRQRRRRHEQATMAAAPAGDTNGDTSGRH
ncbi:hypothetical protein BJV78DRAFT_1290482 [Lactifluus subvellereus]|nr:hypothetical protein BJV78DRAFT_1290482 [Lactifluus subvellereus]